MAQEFVSGSNNNNHAAITHNAVTSDPNINNSEL